MKSIGNPSFNSFGQNAAPYHTHNGIDSPLLVSTPNSSSGTIYAGSLNSDATVVFLPSGWTAVVGSGGSVGKYTVTHNLGTSNYAIVVTATAGFNYGAVTSVGTSTFIVTMYSIGVGGSVSPTDTAFNFILAMN